MSCGEQAGLCSDIRVRKESLLATPGPDAVFPFYADVFGWQPETFEDGGGAVLQDAFDAPPFRRAVIAAPDGAAFTVSELRLPGR